MIAKWSAFTSTYSLQLVPHSSPGPSHTLWLVYYSNVLLHFVVCAPGVSNRSECEPFTIHPM